MLGAGGLMLATGDGLENCAGGGGSDGGGGATAMGTAMLSFVVTVGEADVTLMPSVDDMEAVG